MSEINLEKLDPSGNKTTSLDDPQVEINLLLEHLKEDLLQLRQKFPNARDEDEKVLVLKAVEKAQDCQREIRTLPGFDARQAEHASALAACQKLVVAFIIKERT